MAVLAFGFRKAVRGRRWKGAAARGALGLLLLQGGLSCSLVQTIAFPGAQGFGALTEGGRGGRVIEVINRSDIDAATGAAVPGSLRAAIEASGPRTVVFRVSGTIKVCQQNKKLVISEPHITIAGQTAPGEGVTLRLDPSCASSALTIATHDVILRHIRIRPGSNSSVDLGNSDALSIAGTKAHDIIIDHCSFSWATDENVDIGWGARNITVQYSIISESLKDVPRLSGGPSGGYGMLIAEGDPQGNHTRQISLHHNLFAHNWYRNPQISIDGLVDYRNNVIYDWGIHGFRVMDVYGPTRMNLIGNYAKAGPSTSLTASVREMWAYHSIGQLPFSYFVLSNLGPSRPSSGLPDLASVWCREHYDDVPSSGADCDPEDYATPTSFAVPTVTTSSPTVAYEDVLANAGATLPTRDAVDLRIVGEVRTGTGRVISDPTEVGGWPSKATISVQADSDHDGMPNSWEFLFGFNAYNGFDGMLDADGDGYTNLEEFLNSTNPLIGDASRMAVTPGL